MDRGHVSFDIVTIVHNERNAAQGAELELAVKEHADREYQFWTVDNRERNRGFGPGCLLGAGWGDATVIGFLNPDTVVSGPFMAKVEAVLAEPGVVITGERFGKPMAEYRKVWGCHDWVCGAAFFVLRDWWEEIGGFDPNFVWGWEETDFIRKTQAAGRRARSIALPITHASPEDDTPEDGDYKRKHFDRGARLFYKRWGQRRHGRVI